MATTADHACWVCGKETESRCLPCSERGFDIFFCSMEHQKLIWKHHKRVCGENSNPFLYPPFDDEEIELFKDAAYLTGTSTSFFRFTRNILLTLCSLGDHPWLHIFQSYEPIFLLIRIENLVLSSCRSLHDDPDTLHLSTAARHRDLILFSLVKHALSSSAPSTLNFIYVKYTLLQFAREILRGKAFSTEQESVLFVTELVCPLRCIVDVVRHFEYNERTCTFDIND
ncbi:hypothetical protein JCM8547_008994 [Rhodosporidiobolus lusitaniae]